MSEKPNYIEAITEAIAEDMIAESRRGFKAYRIELGGDAYFQLMKCQALVTLSNESKFLGVPLYRSDPADPSVTYKVFYNEIKNWTNPRLLEGREK